MLSLLPLRRIAHYTERGRCASCHYATHEMTFPFSSACIMQYFEIEVVDNLLIYNSPPSILVVGRINPSNFGRSIQNRQILVPSVTNHYILLCRRTYICTSIFCQITILPHPSSLLFRCLLPLLELLYYIRLALLPPFQLP